MYTILKWNENEEMVMEKDQFLPFPQNKPDNFSISRPPLDVMKWLIYFVCSSESLIYPNMTF